MFGTFTYYNTLSRIFFIFLCFSFIVSNSFSQRAITCYAVSDVGNPDKLFKYTSVSGSWDTLGSTGLNGIEAIAYKPANNTLYTANGNALYQLSLIDGTGTRVNSSITFGTGTGSEGSIAFTDIDGMTYDPINDILWASHRRAGVSTDLDVVFQIDPNSGAIISDAFGTNVDYLAIPAVFDSVRLVDVYDVDDLALDPLTNQLYLIQNQGGTGGMLTILNPSDGTVSIVGSFGGIDDMEGLGFDETGQLYGTTGTNGPDPNDSNKLFEIDKSNGNVLELAPVDPTNTERDFESCDCYAAPLSEITGQIYRDDNCSNSQTGGESDISNVIVSLYNDANNNGTYEMGVDFLIDQESTDVTGNYTFTIPAQGDHLIVIDESTLPTNYYMLGDPIIGFTNIGNDTTITSPAYPGSVINGNVYLDENKNSLYDVGIDSLLNQIDVALEYPDGSYVFTSTDVNGQYSFSGAPEGANIVRVNFGDQDMPNSLIPFQDYDGVSSQNVAFVTNTPCSSTSNVDFSYTYLSENCGSGNAITLDFEFDGNSNPTSIGQVIDDEYSTLGITLSSLNTDGSINTTNPLVIFDTSNPTFGVDSGNSDPSDGDCDLGTPGYNCNDNIFDLANDCTGSFPGQGVGGYNNCAALGKVIVIEEHFVDLNSDGFDDSPDDLASGGIMSIKFDSPVDVKTIGLVDDPIGTIDFIFANPNINTETYTINTGADNDTLLLNFNHIFVSEIQIKLSTSGGLSYIDACTSIPASIGNFVWLDENADGVNDPNEDGINGVKVYLYDASDLTTPIDSTVSNTHVNVGDGFYEFTGLMPGQYVVEFDSISNLVRSPSDASPNGDVDDSDANEISGQSSIINLSQGENNVDIDAGYFEPASIGNYVFNDLNGDGIQDPTEIGILGVQVVLTDESGQAVLDVFGNPVDTVSTDGNGLYTFENLSPGDYIVTFIQPTNLIPTIANVTGNNNDTNDTNIDSDATDMGMSHIINLTSGETDNRIDAGFYLPGSLGNFVWLDEDADGFQDPTEEGINGVTVNLYLDENMDNIPDPGSLIESVITMNNGISDGYYLFDSLPSNKYIIEFVNEDLGITVQDQVNDNSDSDVNQNGMTDFISLAPGENDLSIDAGFTEYAEIGNQVWIDHPSGMDNILDGQDSLLKGITVYLYDASDLENPIDSTVTGDLGIYLFDSLSAGQYVIEVINPGPYIFVESHFASDDSVDSDVDVNGLSHIIVLSPGESNHTIDAGLMLGTVPVILHSFSGSHNIERNINILQWVVSQELDFQNFELQRFEDGKYRTIAVVNASGSINVTTYEESDKDIIEGKIYQYRLKMNNLNGSVSYSEKVEITVSHQGQGIVIYPNPTRNNLTIHYNSDSTYKLQIYNNSGTLLQQHNVNNHLYIINVIGLSSGQYFLKIIDNNTVVTRKWQKID